MKGPFHYEPLIRVPLVMRWPRRISGGRRVPTLVSHVDVRPTLLSAAGVASTAGACARSDGLSLLPVLTDGARAVRDAALVECVDDPEGLRLKTLVTEDRKLTWYCGQPYGELYDLARDPGELTNLWDDAAYAGDRARLLGRLLTELESLEKRAPRLSYA
ncbi:MAG: sulfatase family protein, partial [Candidatus Rokuibacteriota bacterium]